MFLLKWNGSSFYSQQKSSVFVTSDASGSWGCGAYSRNSGSWFQVEWPASWHSINIAIKELVPIVINAALWITEDH